MMTTTRESRHRAKVDRILAAAMAEVRTVGVEELSLRAVARRARYSPAGLYEFFDSKAHLVDELAARAHDRLAAALGRAGRRESDPEGRLVEMGRAYVRFALRNRDDFLLLFGRSSSRRSLAQDVPPESAYGLMRSAVRAVLGSAASDPDTLEAFSFGFWSTVHGMAMLRLVPLAGFRADFDTAGRMVLASVVAAWREAPARRRHGRK